MSGVVPTTRKAASTTLAAAAAVTPAAATATLTASPAAASSAATTTGTVSVFAAGDQYEGSPAFTVSVDGVMVGGPFNVTTAYSSGNFQEFTLTGVALEPTSVIKVNYINDLSGSGGDRNLYVGSVVVNGQAYQGSVAALGTNGVLTNAGALWTDGSLTFNVTAPVAASTGKLSLVGVNMSGAEESGALNPNTVLGVNYFYPTNAEIAYYASQGLNIIRLPFQWERLQPTLGGALSSADLAQIDRVVAYANSLGMKIILDNHNYGAYDGNPIGSAATPISAFVDFWSKLAAHFAGNSNVLFGLMNEPDLPAATWVPAVNSAIASIRATGAVTQKILVSGSIDWDSTTNWVQSGDATTIGTSVVDPSNNYAFEVHEYLDSNGSGVGGDTVSATIGVDRMTAVTEWARDTGHKLFLGEFGVNSDALAITAENNMLSYMAANSDVWLGTTEWCAATSYNYYFNVQPVNGVISPQLAALEKYAPGTDTVPVTGSSPTPPAPPASNPAPVLSSVATSLATTDTGSVAPFAKIGISDPTAATADSATITLTDAAGAPTDANGRLTGTGLTHTGIGVYTLAATSLATLVEELASVAFLPTAASSAITTKIALAVSNGTTSSSATTSVVASAPVAGGGITVALSEDAYAGNAQGYITIDGKAVGGLETITASHALGQSNDFTFADNFGTGPLTISVQFINDAYGGSAALDRNLYVNSIAVNGAVLPGTAAALYSDRTATFVLPAPSPAGSDPPKPTPAPAPTLSGIAATSATTDTGMVDPFAKIGIIDPVAGARDQATITLTNAAGQATDANGRLTGTGVTHTGVGSYEVASITPAALDSELATMAFLPTANQTTIGSAVTTGIKLAVSDGTATSTATTAIVAAEVVGSITVSLSEDAYLGNAQGYITVDGKAVGGLETVTASHALGQSEVFTFTGDFGTGPQTASVQFTNDAYGGRAALDRNLYVNSIAVNGAVLPGTAAALYSDRTATFALAVPGTSTTASVHTV